MSDKKLIIFAGANGSGKTTATRFLLPKLGIDIFVNADDMAQGLSRFNPSGQALAAGRLVLDRIAKLIKSDENFAIETTLAGQTLRKLLQNARDKNYKIEMHYIYCNDIRVNLSRIKFRVEQGGHHVPAEDVKRRYWRSLKNFLTYQKVCDTIVLYDTTDGIPQEFARKDGQSEFDVYDVNLYSKFEERLIDATKNH